LKHDKKKIEELGKTKILGMCDSWQEGIEAELNDCNGFKDSMKQYAEHMVQQERKKFISNLIEREEENLELLKEELNLINNRDGNQKTK